MRWTNIFSKYTIKNNCTGWGSGIVEKKNLKKYWLDKNREVV
jgi:hypothetical protein